MYIMTRVHLVFVFLLMTFVFLKSDDQKVSGVEVSSNPDEVLM